MSSRDRIVEAASGAFVRDGLFGARLEDIRRDAGVSVGALYHHFADKESLHADAWLSALADYQGGFLATINASADAKDGVKAAVRHHLRWIGKNRESALLLLGSRPSGVRANERIAQTNQPFFSQVRRWWRSHARYGTLRDLPVELVYALWLGPADSYARQWLLEGTRRPLSSAAVGELADAAWSVLKTP